MEAKYSSETSVYNNLTQRHNSEDGNLHVLIAYLTSLSAVQVEQVAEGDKGDDMPERDWRYRGRPWESEGRWYHTKGKSVLRIADGRKSLRLLFNGRLWCYRYFESVLLPPC
jgi:hypothetical protein